LPVLNTSDNPHANYCETRNTGAATLIDLFHHIKPTHIKLKTVDP